MPTTAAPLASSSLSTCLQQYPHLPSLVAFYRPCTCLQQSPHLPSAISLHAFNSPAHAFNSPSTCLQQSLLLHKTVPPLAFSKLFTCLQQLPQLSSAVSAHAFNSPCPCLQQSLRLPSAVLFLPAAVPALVFSSPHYLQTSICLQQSSYLPSAVSPHAFNSPSTCLQRSVHLPSAVPDWKSTWSCSVLYLRVTCGCAARKAALIASTPLKLISKAAGCLAHLMRLPCRYA